MLWMPERPRAIFTYDNYPANPPTNYGTSVVPGASNAEGAWTQIATAANISFEVCAFTVFVTLGNTSGAQKDHLLDVGIDTAGGSSYTAILSNLVCGQAGGVSNGGRTFCFPLHIPAGSSVAVRIQGSNATAGTVRIAMRFYGGPNSLGLPCGQFSETIGTITNSGGVSYTPGNAADGSWVSLGTTTNPLWWWQLGVQISNGTTTAAQCYTTLAYGDASTKHTIGRLLTITPGTTEIDAAFPNFLVPFEAFCPVPAGSTIYVMGRCSTAPVTGYNAVAIGIGG